MTWPVKAACYRVGTTFLAPICRAFDKLKEVRQLEYELDFAQNRARRDLTALQARLDAMTATRCATCAC